MHGQPAWAGLERLTRSFDDDWQALPLFIDRLLSPVAAIAISVSAVLLFGEVIPQVRSELSAERLLRRVCRKLTNPGHLQAVCSRYGLAVGMLHPSQPCACNPIHLYACNLRH